MGDPELDLYLESHSTLTGWLLTSVLDIEMPTDKNIRCTIHTKDGPLHEYYDGLEDQSSSGSSSSIKSVYVQAENAVTFWFVTEILAGHKNTVGDCISFAYYIDGKPMGNTCSRGTGFYNEYRLAFFNGFSKSFQFAEISTGTPPPPYLVMKVLIISFTMPQWRITVTLTVVHSLVLVRYPSTPCVQEFLGRKGGVDSGLKLFKVRLVRKI